MGLFGALFAGVSGLDSQSNKIGIISNNISNVNTIGFKQGSAAFDSLVVPSISSSAFSPGGVISQNQQLVNQQGIIQSTTSSTDIAIDGNGLFIVNTASDGSGQKLYTRAGSFTQDSLGNFVNSNGFFLQGFTLGTNGQATTNMETVNVKGSASGAATPTTNVSLAANLNASEATLLGSGETVTLAGTNNVGIPAAQLIVGNDYSQDSVSGIVRGDAFTVTSGSGLPETFTYGGITIGRNVADGTSAGNGDGNTVTNPQTLFEDDETNSTITPTSGQTTMTITVSTAAATTLNTEFLAGNTFVNLGSVGGTIGGVSASNIDGIHTITAVDTGTNTITVDVGVTATSSTAATGQTIDITNRSAFFAGNILDATTDAATFLTQTPVTDFTSAGLTFKIATTGGQTSTFQYVATAPDVTQGQFNNLTTLQEAISNTPGLTATIAGGRLYVGATNANLGLTFTNGATGSGSINWVQELGLPTTAIANVNASAVSGRFNSLSSLATAVNATTDLTATLANPLGSATLSINESNPQETIQFSDDTLSHGGSGNTGSIMTEFGFKGPLGAALTGTGAALTTGTLPVTYTAGNYLTNMSSGAVKPQFSYDVTIYDSLGDPHTVAFNFAKISASDRQWAVELTAVPPTDVSSSPDGSDNEGSFGPSGDGYIASGTVTFKGNGDLGQISSALANPITIPWATGASSSTITLGLGTANTTSGLSQFSAAFNVTQANQNGAAVGELTGVSVDQSGFVIASYSNGQSQKIFQIPLASVSNPDGLEAVSGDAYSQTEASGVVNPVLAGSNGTGTFSPSSLEESNVDLSQQLTDLIVAQQAYGANTKLLTVTSTLLQELNQIIQ